VDGRLKYVAVKVKDCDDWDPPLVLNHLSVDEFPYIPTGILTAEGDMICHCPLPIGFGRDAEW
jgi:hypothetical protein